MFIKLIEMIFLLLMNNEWENKKFQNLKKLFLGYNDIEIIYKIDISMMDIDGWILLLIRVYLWLKIVFMCVC